MKWLILLLFFLLFAAQAEAATYWVNANATNSAKCVNSPTDPGVGSSSKTVAQGLSCVGAAGTEHGGDTVIVKAGTYIEALDDIIPSGSSAQSIFTLKCETDFACNINPASGSHAIQIEGATAHYVLIQGFKTSTGKGFRLSHYNVTDVHDVELRNNEIDAAKADSDNFGISVSGASYVTLYGNRIHDQNGCGAQCHGIYLSDNTDHITLDHNIIYNNGTGYGIQFYGPNITNHTVRYNTVYNNGSSGEVVYGSGHLIYGNIFYGNTTGGILLRGSSNLQIYNNTVYNNGGGGIYSDNNDDISASCVNNIAYNNSTPQIRNCATTASYNYCSSGCTGTGTINSSTDPFVDAANGNFQLKSTSTAKDAGADLGSTYNRDFANVFRPQGTGWDIGAYEWEVTTPPPGAPVPVLALGLNEGTGTTANDASGQGNNGTLVNATWFSTGRFGKAIQLSGAVDSYIRVPHSASLNLSSAGMTLSAWIFPTSLPSDPEQFVSVMYKTSDSGPGYYLFAKTASPPNDYVCVNGYAGGGFSVTTHNTACEQTSAIPTGSWTHVAVTYDGTNLRFYKNGQLTDTRQAADTLGTNSADLIIGNSLFGEALTGLIDEVRVYNYALTPTEIATMYLTPIEQQQVVTPKYQVAPATDVKVSAATLIKKGAQ